ncbi:MAG: hypothetical protein V7749_05090, partial [Cocleimonas sp.]
GTESYLSDTDGDTVKDAEEIGKNQDKPLDSDNDGVIDALDYDDDNDGLPTYLESKQDSDKDGQLDYLDMDSDNDGITDGEEAGFLNQDINLDGIDDAFDIGREGAVDNNGDGIDDNFKLPDHNADGIPDYLDAKFQYLKQILAIKNTQKNNEEAKSIAISKTKIIDIKKAIVKVDEPPKLIVAKDKKNNAKSKKLPNMIINRHTDSDNDGLSNELEKLLGTNHLNRDSDGDNVSDAIEIGMDVNAPQDSDHDGIIDALDNDDDNDGILTKLEDLNKDNTAINDDTDSDGVPNYLDANDDGDNLLTKAEGFVMDSDGDGILDYLDKNDDTKDQLDSSNAIQVSLENSEITEPEIVVLFDGDAAALVAEEDENQEETLSSVGSSLQYTQSEVAGNTDLDKAKHDENVGEVQASKSSTKRTSHWNLF